MCFLSIAHGSSGCKGNPERGPDARPELTAALRSELSFVPASVEVLVRLDLGALAERDPEMVGMLDFILRAQQPAAGEVVAAADLTLGRDVRALVLCANVSGGVPHTMVAAIGSFDGDEVAEHVAASTGMPAETAEGGRLFTWQRAAPHAFGSAEVLPKAGEAVAVGVTDGLLLLGTPAVVREGLAARGSQRGGQLGEALVHDVAHAPPGALAWGVARGAGVPILARDLAPGLVSARFHAAPGGSGAAKANVALRAEFSSDAEAVAFQARLVGFLAQGAALAGTSGVGTALAKLRDDGAVKRRARVVEIAGAL